jgi:hypothetical protein
LRLTKSILVLPGGWPQIQLKKVFNKGNYPPCHDTSGPGVQGVQNARGLKRKHTRDAGLEETGGAQDDDDPDE